MARRAISPLIATIILIAITVAAGLMIYSMFLSASSILGAKGQVSVENVKLVKDSGGSVTFAITIKNIGNKPVAANGLSIKLAGQDVSVSLSNPLQPGQSISAVTEAPQIQAGYVVGNTYTVAISATFTDGSSFSDTITVTCTSA